MKDYERMAIKSKISSNQERKSTRIKLNTIDLNQIRNILHMDIMDNCFQK